MECIFIEEIGYENLWEQTLVKINKPAIFYSPLQMKYSLKYASKWLLNDLSFVIMANNTPVALCPIFLEVIHGIKQFSFAGGYLRSPLIDKSIGDKKEKKVQKYIFDIIDGLSKDYKSKKHMCLIDVHNTFNDQESYNYLTKNGYLDSSIATQMIDLRKNLDQLWKEVRKGCKWNINQGHKNYKVDIFDYNFNSFSIHEAYRKMHHKAAGRVTRSIETFNLQYEMLKNDEAILIGVKYNDDYKAFAYFIHNNKGAYYASYANDPDFKKNIPLGHIIIWKAIEYYKERKFLIFETGIQQFGYQIFDRPSLKEINIGMFKRGFGGNAYPLFRGIKFYDKKQLLIEIETFKKNIELTVVSR